MKLLLKKRKSAYLFSGLVDVTVTVLQCFSFLVVFMFSLSSSYIYFNFIFMSKCGKKCCKVNW